ncbi:MAG: hypothetical protein H3C37_06285 [Candidatus Kapabacteria bacterium]|nr:hypothetical protein [Candidatus Kapabacteria bacterium]
MYFLQKTFGIDTTNMSPFASAILINKANIWFNTNWNVDVIQQTIDTVKSMPSWPYVSPEDKNILDSLESFFATYSTSDKTWQIVASELSVAALDFLNIADSMSYSGESGGELARGVARVMHGSSLLWTEKYPSIPNGDSRKNADAFVQVIQADAAGYIFGWFRAIKEEIDQNGKLDIKNQWKRIEKATNTGIEWSAAAMLVPLVGV